MTNDEINKKIAILPDKLTFNTTTAESADHHDANSYTRLTEIFADIDHLHKKLDKWINNENS